MTTPLKHVRVLDLTNVLAGPFCCHQLAHLGADVIKVEVPGTGDLARQLGADAALNAKLSGVSFLAQNTGKRSITINLKAQAGKQLFKRLVATADVLVENFRPGVMDRLGVGYDSLKADNPDLIYCAISGFGQEGPMRDLPAYDQIVQGMSGLMSITGNADTAPLRAGFPVADTIGGMTAAFAISSALSSLQKPRGTFIDISMLEAVISTMGWVASNYLIAGQDPRPMGNDNFSASPSGLFATGDGPINIAANKQEQFEAVCRVVGKTELITDPRFATRQARLDNRGELNALLERALSCDNAKHWQQKLNEAGVPAGRVLSLPEVLDEPQIADRGLIGSFDHVPGLDGKMRFIRTGIKLDGQAPITDRPPPTLGQHSQELLAELGYSNGDIAALRADEAI